MRLWKNLTRFLFDTTSAQENQGEVESILREVLATCRPGETFDHALSRVLDAREAGSSFNRAHYFKRFLRENCRQEDRAADLYTSDLFTVARHVLQDLPQIYGSKAAKG